MTNVVLSVEHYPVYTTGIRTKGYTRQEETVLKNLGADFVRTNRGGLITFHGPGQLVVYPVLNLRQFVPATSRRKAALGMKWYINSLEQVVIDGLDRFGLTGTRSEHTGVWIGEDKVCAMGVASSNMVTSHGLAINCDVDMSWYRHIVPCGIEDKGVTSMSRQLGRGVGVEEMECVIREQMGRQFGCEMIEVDDWFRNYITEITGEEMPQK